MTIFDFFAKLTGNRRSKAEAALVTLARKEARGEITEADVPALELALQASSAPEGKEFFNQSVATVQEYDRLASIAATLPAMEREAEKLAGEIKRAEEEVQRVFVALASKLNEKRHQLGSLTHRIDQATAARFRRDVLAAENETLLESKPLDLDRHTLVYGGSLNGCCDPAAPLLGVPAKVYHREVERRGAIMAFARREKAIEHQAAMTAWLENGAKKDPYGAIISNAGRPELEEPTWAELVRSKSKLLTMTDAELAQADRPTFSTSAVVAE